jgi:hypothetical protein
MPQIPLNPELNCIIIDIKLKKIIKLIIEWHLEKVTKKVHFKLNIITEKTSLSRIKKLNQNRTIRKCL